MELTVITRGKNKPPEEAIFKCVGMLAVAVGPNLTTLLREQLNLMLACGLSEALRQALSDIARSISVLSEDVQGKDSEPFHLTSNRHFFRSSAELDLIYID